MTTHTKIQKELLELYGGEMEVTVPLGRVDIVTPTEIMEVKTRPQHYQKALGQLLAYKYCMPDHRPVLILDSVEEIPHHIQELMNAYGIEVRVHDYTRRLLEEEVEKKRAYYKSVLMLPSSNAKRPIKSYFNCNNDTTLTSEEKDLVLDCLRGTEIVEVCLLEDIDPVEGFSFLYYADVPVLQGDEQEEELYEDDEMTPSQKYRLSLALLYQVFINHENDSRLRTYFEKNGF
jgi:hypothetical protein